MKYRVDLKKVSYETSTVFAASHEEAIANAVAGLPGFKAEYVTELLSETTEGECHTVVGHCEACHNGLIDEQYRPDGDGLLFCPKCYEEMGRDAEEQP